MATVGTRFEPRISPHHTMLGILVTAVFGFCAVSSNVPTVDASWGSGDTTNTTDTTRTAVSRVVDSLQARGLTCQDEAELTDSVVFQRNDQSVEVVSFNRAYTLSRAGVGWVRAYCA